MHESSIGEGRDDFWRYWAEQIQWIKKPTKILDSSKPPFYKWFPDATLNITESCLDRHVKTMPDHPALIYEGPIAKEKLVWSYKKLLEQTELFAGVLANKGIKKGDTVIIYMPMILESAAVMLACARIGAIHSVVFGGFAAKELSGRIEDSGAKLIVSASCGLEPNKTIKYRPLIRKALELIGQQLPVIYVQRKQFLLEDLSETESLYSEEMKKATPVKAVEVDSNHPLYILYTSGTTGVPKGIVRDQGGTAVALNLSIHIGFDLQKKEVIFASSDIGWVVGHSYIIYGPLIRGATSIIYEGKPNTPDPGAYYEVIDRLKVKVFYTSPTAMRFLRKLDPNGLYPKKYDLSTVKVCGVVGERTDIHTFQYIQGIMPKDCLYNDTYWQTESGWFMSANFMNPETFKVKGGSCTKPYPGYELSILDDDGKPVEGDNLGNVVFKLPLPPSFMTTLWKNDSYFEEKYMSQFPGYYVTADSGYVDKDGYLHIMSRVDDIISTAGHRLSTAAMEECLISHHSLAAAAVIGALDDLKGTVPVGFVVVKEGEIIDSKVLTDELVKLIRKDIGPVACLKTLFVVDGLPKTRSGKILRRTLKSMVDGKEFDIPATIEDPAVLDEIHKKVLESNCGKKRDIVYEEDVNDLQKPTC